MLLLGCAANEVIPQPVIVEVPGPTEIVPVPAELLVQHQKVTIPEILNYGEALLLWAEDRSIIDRLLGQLIAIESLAE